MRARPPLIPVWCQRAVHARHSLPDRPRAHPPVDSGTHHDQQHESSGLLWLAVGAAAGLLHAAGTTTGVHFFVAAAGQLIMILAHVQFSELSTLQHRVHAAFNLAAGAARAAGAIPEYALLMALSAGSFVASSECPIRFAEDRGVNPAAYSVVVLALTTLLWSRFAIMILAPTAARPRARRARGGGGSDTDGGSSDDGLEGGGPVEGKH